MSSDPKWAQICAAEEFVVLDSPSFCAPSLSVSESPIDDFYTYLKEVLPLGSEEDLNQSQVLGRVLLLGLVSGVELYFRSILAHLVETCPLSREHAGKHNLSLASLDYYGIKRVGLGLLENVSFATEGEIEKYTLKIANLQPKANSSVMAAIKGFETLCHLRHAAVHSRGELNSGNLRSLNMQDRKARRALILRLSQLHQAAATCQSAVRGYNRWLFREVVDRWITRGLLTADWKRDGRLFRPLFESFQSKVDRTGPKGAVDAYRELRPLIVKRAGRILP